MRILTNTKPLHHDDQGGQPRTSGYRTCSVASSVSTSPLAVITVVGILEVPMVSNSSQEYPFLRCEVECSLVCFFELLSVFEQVSMSCFGRIALAFQSLHGTYPQISWRPTSVMKHLDIYFPQRWSFPFPDTRLTWR